MIRGEVFVRYRYNELSLRQVAEGYSSNSTNLIIACIDKVVVRNFLEIGNGSILDLSCLRHFTNFLKNKGRKWL